MQRARFSILDAKAVSLSLSLSLYIYIYIYLFKCKDIAIHTIVALKMIETYVPPTSNLHRLLLVVEINSRNSYLSRNAATSQNTASKVSLSA